MIGIKIENNFLKKMLQDWLKENAEPWEKGHIYQVVLTDLEPDKLKKFQKNENSKLIILGRKETSFDSFEIPFTLDDLEKKLKDSLNIYENKTFFWDSKHRQLKNKKTGKIFQLTEKEANLIDFLRKSPGQKATKEELLKNVWKYTQDAETHTVESTIYTFRKKIAPDSDKMIQSNQSNYHLV